MASLVADYSSSSGESEEDVDSDNTNETSDGDGKQTARLPRPEFGADGRLPRPEFGADGSTLVKNSVFSNPFVEAENAKRAILEKHVKMTPTKDEIKTINGKKICWNFRKGRCRFGHNCKFAHDSDLYRSESEEPSESVPCQNNQVAAVEEEVISNSEVSQISRKKRPGLSQTLVPGKKVMKMYKKQVAQTGAPKAKRRLRKRWSDTVRHVLKSKQAALSNPWSADDDDDVEDISIVHNFILL